jgi:ATP-binding cassette subfamily A (ABC1) protein 3
MTGSQAAPVYTHVAMNALVRAVTGDASAFIQTDLLPFAFTKAEVDFLNRFNGLTTAIVVSIGYCFIPSAIAVFVVQERETKAKHIQMISGVSIEAYWLSSYLWDFVSCLIPTLIGAFIVLGFGNENFVGENFGSVFLTMFMYALSVVPFTYVLSFLFKSHSTAQNVMILLYLLTGLAPYPWLCLCRLLCVSLHLIRLSHKVC